MKDKKPFLVSLAGSVKIYRTTVAVVAVIVVYSHHMQGIHPEQSLPGELGLKAIRDEIDRNYLTSLLIKMLQRSKDQLGRPAPKLTI